MTSKLINNPGVEIMYRSLNIKSLVSFLTVLALSVSFLTACDDDKKEESSTTNTLQTGVFLDSPVINIGYRTETQSDVTNSLGEYQYFSGEMVTFFIGDLEFPTVPAIEIVTPLDLAGTQNTLDPTVVNIIRLLQTLDKDGNLDNGIAITEIAESSATAVDFSLSESLFEDSSAVINLTSNAGLDTPISLISTADAIAHFENELSENNIPHDATPVSFSDSGLKNTTIYNVYFEDEVSEWVIETLSFGDQNNVDLDGEPATFSVTNGILRLTFADGFDDIKIISFDETLNARVTCWESTIDPQFDCAADGFEYMFSSLAEAQAFRDTKNGTNNGTSVNFSASVLKNTSIYNVYFETDVSEWVTEALSFDDQNNVVLDGEPGTFTVINGVLVLTFGVEVDQIKIISFDETLNARVTCWDSAITPQFDCVGNELEYMFSSPAEAQAFRDSKN